MPNSLEWTISKDQLTTEESYHVGETYSVTYQLKNNLPVAFPVKFITTGSDSAFSFTGCDSPLEAKGGTCQLTVSFTPITPGEKKVFLEASLANKLFIILDKTFTVLEAKEKANVEGKVTKDLDSTILVGVPQDIEFLFTNISATPANKVSVEITKDGG